MVMKWVVALLLAAVVMAPVAATDVSMSIEPPEPVANESFRIIFRADGPVDAEPDFTELEALHQSGALWSHTTHAIKHYLVIGIEGKILHHDLFKVC